MAQVALVWLVLYVSRVLSVLGRRSVQVSKVDVMSKLDALYGRMLQLGLLVAREAISTGDLGWALAEVELLHNLPSLLGEQDINRHRYFWDGERAAYVEWMSLHGSAEANIRMHTFYYPLWDELEKVISEL